jgi:hypothetical protein
MNLALRVGPFIELGVSVGGKRQRTQKQKPPGVNPEGLIVEFNQLIDPL